MTEFAKVVLDHWVAPFESAAPVHDGATFRMAINDAMTHGKRVQILSRPQRTCVLVTEAVGKLPGVLESRSEDDFRKSIEAAGIKLNGADFLFFLPREAQRILVAEEPRAGVRRLTEADADAFKAFEAEIPAEDLDGAAVGIDDWMAYGAFENGVLVAVGSSYPVQDAALADIGVVTHPGFRRQGHARSIVHALARAALKAKHEPQYRCQLDNPSSAALARRLGFAALATWDIPLPDEDR